jgi:hypothetical protein
LLSLSALRAFALTIFAFLMLPTIAWGESSPSTGGTAYEAPPATNMSVEGAKAKLLPDGTAAAPAGAPIEVQKAIWAANSIQDRPYKWGGGHAKIEDTGYDCSGTVSYALLHAGLLDSPIPSGTFMHWGARGRGQWITVFANGGHAYAVIAGLRLDTSAYATRSLSKRRYAKAYERGPRWRPTKRPATGFRKRHPVGF